MHLPATHSAIMSKVTTMKITLHWPFVTTIFILMLCMAFAPNRHLDADDADLVKVYFPLLYYRDKPTVTPTKAPTATPTKTPLPTATHTPKPPMATPTPPSGNISSPKPSYPTPAPYGDCLPSDPNYRDKGGNGSYKFCVAEDLNWVNVPHAPPVQRFAAGTDKWMTLQWNVYGINAIRLAADPSSQIANCGPKGNSGFNKPVNGNGNYTFNLKELGAGQYKFELFITRSDGVIVGHNEVFICLI